MMANVRGRNLSQGNNKKEHEDIFVFVLYRLIVIEHLRFDGSIMLK
jgi:hypothetical protein